MKKKLAADKIELFDENGESRGFYSIKNRLNDLTGKEWVYWTKSVITNQYPPNLQHKFRSQHGGQKPPDLCADIIRIFTKKNQQALDPFAGVGGTLLGASRCNRKATGIEINPACVEIYRQVCELEKIELQTFVTGDSCSELLKFESNMFDFLLTDVPYWNMDIRKKSKGKFKRADGALKEPRKSKLKKFNNICFTNKQEWLDMLKQVFSSSIPLLKKGAYLAVFIGDMYNNGQYHFLSADLAALLGELGLVMKANLVWYDVSKSLHVYGYLYQFIPSMIHQNILIFRNE